jgi:asparagine synthetase B (glutamine-hydrolysing)
MKDFPRTTWLGRLKLWRPAQSFARVFGQQYFIFDEESACRICPSTDTPPLRPDPLSNMEPIGRVTGMLLSGYTRDQLLADTGAAAMWHGLEVRLPLLDEELLEFALNLPPEAKLGAGDPAAPSGSYAASGVKRILLDIGTPFLPADFATRSKCGFTLPFDAWLTGVLAPVMRDLLSPATVKQRGFFEPEAVQSVAQDFAAGVAHWTRPWLLMATELWAEQVLDNASNNNASTGQSI